MNISQQKLNSIDIVRLKGHRELFIDFNGSRLTAIMGPNGSGKSTILHALACSYKSPPSEASLQRQFYQFFTPTTDSTWAGSSFTINIDYREGESVHSNETVSVSKNVDRWSPKTNRRPVRSIRYIPIITSVPTIENEKNRSFVSYTTNQLTDDMSETIKRKAGYILNRDYTAFNILRAARSQYIGVEHRGQRYSALSMGAGEQRVFKILDEIYHATKYSLILIDEIDILLHEVAIRKLIETLYERAEEKHLQIIFTSHSPVLFSMESLINIRHIYQTPNKTFCFNDTKPDAIYRLTGRQNLPLEVFVEDDLAQSIVEKISSDLSIKKYVSIRTYGPADNCFSLASGFILKGDSIHNSLFVIDGDKYRTADEKKCKIQAVLTGSAPEHYILRETVLRSITQFNLPDGFSPEKYIWSKIKEIGLISEYMNNEIVQTANDIEIQDENHKYVDDIITRIGYNTRSVGLNEIVHLLSKSYSWNEFVEPVKNWLNNKKAEVIEHA